MIVYEVRATMPGGLAEAYRAWLAPHVREILAIRGFRYAELHLEEQAGDASTLLIRYHLESREALEIYLRDHSPRMRADAANRFGEQVETSRRVTELIESFDLR